MEPNTSQREDVTKEADAEGPFHDAIIVYFDLDVTDMCTLNKGICQISAKYKGNKFNQYIMPKQKISQKSSAIHGIEIRLIENERKLFHNGNEVNALPPREGLEKLLDFLSNQNGRVLLTAHSCFKFDGLIIIRQIKEHDLLERFESLVVGFIDTLPIFRFKWPERKQEKKGFSLPKLAADYIDAQNIPKRRDATVQVEILVLLITTTGCTDAVMKKQYARSLTKCIALMPENVENRKTGLKPLSGAVTENMIATIAKAGISMKMLQDVYTEERINGVAKLLQEDIEGKPRVTKSRRIIQLIIDRLSELSLADNENAPAN